VNGEWWTVNVCSLHIYVHQVKPIVCSAQVPVCYGCWEEMHIA
jgi:hypothetical protein